MVKILGVKDGSIGHQNTVTSSKRGHMINLPPQAFRLIARAFTREMIVGELQQAGLDVPADDKDVIATLEPGGPKIVELTTRAKVFFRVFVARGGRLLGVRVVHLSEGAEGPEVE